MSGYSGGRRSPIGIGGAVAVHALVFGAYLLMPKEVIDTFHSSPFTTYAVPETPPPPPEEAAPGTDSKRSEEHTSELQSLMRISYAVFCLKKKKQHTIYTYNSLEH